MLERERERERERGFTLVELSIVLVVVALIIGGILMGKDLIKAAEIRAAASQLLQYESAYRTFQTKYNCTMGDCPNATAFFGSNYTSYGCTTTSAVGNGNGNGLIDHCDGSGNSAGWDKESNQASDSLQLANLLPTSLTTPCAYTAPMFKGINDSCAYFFHDDLYFKIPSININSITWASPNFLGNVNSGALSPIQARLIDEKIDDGKPTTGKFRGLDVTAVGSIVFTTNSCSTSGAYNLNENYTCRSVYYFK